jgi:hypothetical protein
MVSYLRQSKLSAYSAFCVAMVSSELDFAVILNPLF